MSEAAIGGERALSGPEKAAALLLMMGKPPAARLLKQFDQPDLRAVALAAAGLGAIPATTLDRLVEEFVTDFSAGADLLGDAGQAKSLLADALPPEQIADILGLSPEETGPPDVWRIAGASAGERDRRLADGRARGDGDLYPFQARSGRWRRGLSPRCRAIGATPRYADWSRRSR